MRRRIGIIFSGIILTFLLSGCAWAQSGVDEAGSVLFETNLGAEYTGYTISFRVPSELEIGYFADSGAYGWLLADTDPSDAFWIVNQTGDELVLLMMVTPNAEGLTNPTNYISQWQEELPDDAAIREYDREDKTIAYFVTPDRTTGAVVSPEMVFLAGGDIPAGKEDIAREAMEMLVETVEFHPTGGFDFSTVLLWGARNEGSLEKESIRTGYLPVTSASTWNYAHDGSSQVTVRIDTGADEAVLIVDFLDENGRSVVPEGEKRMSGAQAELAFSLTGSGVFTLQVRPAENSIWYGWYQIEIR